jgi:hypothetical protein
MVRNSNSAKQHQDDHDDQDRAEDTCPGMTEAITVASEAPAEPAKQKNDKNDDQNRAERHGGFSFSWRLPDRDELWWRLCPQPGVSIALDRDTVFVDFDIDAALAFLIKKIACPDQADGEYYRS